MPRPLIQHSTSSIQHFRVSTAADLDALLPSILDQACKGELWGSDQPETVRLFDCWTVGDGGRRKRSYAESRRRGERRGEADPLQAFAGIHYRDLVADALGGLSSIPLKNLHLHTFATCLLEQASDLTGGAQGSFRKPLVAYW